MIGIDKIVLSNVIINAIDWDKFDKHPASRAKLAQNDQPYREISGLNVAQINTGTHSNAICLEAKMAPDKNTGTWIPTEKLFINPATLLYGNNVRNINSPDELINAVNMVEKRLVDDYGIEIDLRQAMINEIEINANIALNRPFSEYKNAFALIEKGLPKRYINKTSYLSEDKFTGFSASNTQIILKLYDKLREAHILLDGSANLLRVEYRFKCSEKVKTAFGFNNLDKLLENFSDIIAVFSHNTQKDILSAMPKYLTKLRKQHREDLALAIEERPKSFIDRWLATTEFIFDYELLSQTLIEVLKEHGRKDRNNRERIKQLKDAVTKRQKETSYFGQMNMLREVIGKLEDVCDIK